MDLWITSLAILSLYTLHPPNRVGPSWVWTYEERGESGSIVGFVNDGIAGVPGVLRISVLSASGQELSSGCLDAGYPLHGRVRQALFPLPKGTAGQGLRLKAEIEIRGNARRYAGLVTRNSTKMEHWRCVRPLA